MTHENWATQLPRKFRQAALSLLGDTRLSRTLAEKTGHPSGDGKLPETRASLVTERLPIEKTGRSRNVSASVLLPPLPLLPLPVVLCPPAFPASTLLVFPSSSSSPRHHCSLFFSFSSCLLLLLLQHSSSTFRCSASCARGSWKCSPKPRNTGRTSHSRHLCCR